jgi:predicted amino acid dehydrogenase
VVLSEVEGMKNELGKPIRGWIITIPLTAKQMLDDRNLAKKKIFQAIELAQKNGAEISGLGAFTSSITNGGKDLINKAKTYITNGNSLVAGVTVSAIEKFLKESSHKDNTNIAIVGATGSVGSAVSKILASRNDLNSLILVGRTPEHLEELKDSIKELNNYTKIKITTNIKNIINADIVIVATNAKDAIIHPQHLKQNAFVYDITQPKNTSEEIINQRKDVKFIDGGLVSTPGINYHFNFGIPLETAFACLVETMVLAAEGFNKHYSIGKVEIEKVKEILELTKKYNFYPYVF